MFCATIYLYRVTFISDNIYFLCKWVAILLSSTLSITLSSLKPPLNPALPPVCDSTLVGVGAVVARHKAKEKSRYIRGKKEKLAERFFFSFFLLFACFSFSRELARFVSSAFVAVSFLRSGCCCCVCRRSSRLALLFDFLSVVHSSLLFSLLLRSTHCSSSVSECYTKRGFYYAHAHLDDTLSDLAHVRSQIHAAVITWEGCTGKSVQVKLMYLTFDIWIIQSSFAGRWTRTLDRGRRRHVGLPWFISRISLFRIFKRVFY